MMDPQFPPPTPLLTPDAFRVAHLIGDKPLRRRALGIWLGLGAAAMAGLVSASLTHPMVPELAQSTQHVAHALVSFSKNTPTERNASHSNERRRQAQASASIHWVHLDRQPDPFTQAFLWDHETQTLQPTHQGLVDFFKGQGLKAEHAKAIVAMMQVSQQTTLAHDDPVFLSHEQARQAYASSWLQKAWELLQDDAFPSEDWEGHVEKALDSEIAQPFLDGRWQAGWDGVEAQLMQPWMVLFPDLTQRNVHDVHTATTFEQARHVLNQSVRETGLAGLRVPATISNDPQALIQLAHMLTGSQQDLHLVTGMKGKTLGLNGRVVLDLQTVQQPAVTYRDPQHSYVVVRSFWDKLPHEWFHALDLSMNEKVRLFSWSEPMPEQSLSSMYSPQLFVWPASKDPYDLLNAQRNLWTSLEQPALSLEDRMSIQRQAPADQDQDQPALVQQINTQAHQETVEDGSVWMHWKTEMAQSTRDGWWRRSKEELYLQNSSETMAFAFGSYVQHQLNQNSEHPHLLHLKFQPSVVHTVSQTESLAQTPAWRTYFKRLQPWWTEDGVNMDQASSLRVSYERIKDRRNSMEGTSGSIDGSLHPSQRL